MALVQAFGAGGLPSSSGPGVQVSEDGSGDLSVAGSSSAAVRRSGQLGRGCVARAAPSLGSCSCGADTSQCGADAKCQRQHWKQCRKGCKKLQAARWDGGGGSNAA